MPSDTIVVPVFVENMNDGTWEARWTRERVVDEVGRSVDYVRASSFPSALRCFGDMLTLQAEKFCDAELEKRVRISEPELVRPAGGFK